MELNRVYTAAFYCITGGVKGTNPFTGTLILAISVIQTAEFEILSLHFGTQLLSVILSVKFRYWYCIKKK